MGLPGGVVVTTATVGAVLLAGGRAGGAGAQEAKELAALYARMAEEFAATDLSAAAIAPLASWFHGTAGEHDTPWPKKYGELDEPLRFGAASIIHSSLLRIVSPEPLGPPAVAAIASACERWTARLRGATYSPASMWFVREAEFSTVVGEREIMPLADGAAKGAGAADAAVRHS
ncbi:hypothetical protein GPECTOR_213g430 [Gonium pectorale]|uniref:Uncharacterized protein n=1 Tax=Gonium pectorale TaxID=33097 RepID=A0A150FYE5_GONPE|nr:hypothetical protein GPECTOR_213g430 [Gonium pectorale]|eukprot:KXZ42060.1 hypothetical protein GPECTOR_213g430 [Gonium pectorale]